MDAQHECPLFPVLDTVRPAPRKRREGLMVLRAK